MCYGTGSRNHLVMKDRFSEVHILIQVDRSCSRKNRTNYTWKQRGRQITIYNPVTEEALSGVLGDYADEAAQLIEPYEQDKQYSLAIVEQGGDAKAGH